MEDHKNGLTRVTPNSLLVDLFFNIDEIVQQGVEMVGKLELVKQVNKQVK